VIPYFEQPSITLGPFTIYAFGFLSALGILVGSSVALRAARRYAGLDPEPLSRALPWAVACGFIGGHLVHVLGYHPELLHERGPLVLLELWDGQASMGGVLGGIIGLVLGFRRARQPLMPYLDSLALGVAPGWAIARIGCFMAHDHPGSLTHFPLAVAFPGGARHDLGLDDALVLGALALMLHLVARKRRTDGVLMGLLAIGYSIPRFFLDFLRARDVAFADGRIFGFTPAQYVVVALFFAGVVLLVRALSTPPNRAVFENFEHAPSTYQTSRGRG
jgi:phosphatidylglycerol:prolipoprotein diacylglycerol transferase